MTTARTYWRSRLTETQLGLLNQLRDILANGPKNTHQIAQARGDRQAYESYLRNRLFRLVHAGLLDVQTTQCSPDSGWVIERKWSLTPLGRNLLRPSN